jgi:hypothetical protein
LIGEGDRDRKGNRGVLREKDMGREKKIEMEIEVGKDGDREG